MIYKEREVWDQVRCAVKISYDPLVLDYKIVALTFQLLDYQSKIDQSDQMR